jgi:hypothetical protein
MAQFGQVHHTGVILKALVLKDLALIATVAARVHIRCAPDPSQAQDDLVMR